MGLRGDTADDAVCVTARKLAAGARQHEGRSVVLPGREPCIQHVACVPRHRHTITGHAACDLHAAQSLAGVWVLIEVDHLRDAEA